MPSEPDSSPALESVAWKATQDVVRAFRRAWRRGERPAIEDYLPEEASNRKPLLLELILEEIALRCEAGDTMGVTPYLERFRDLSDDTAALRELTEASRASTIVAKAGVALRPSTRLGRYELAEVIGQGAFGVVHRGRDTTLNRDVAVKRLRSGAPETPEAVARFLREARSAAVLHHPHIVPVYDAGQADGELYLVAALVEGRNLADELTIRRPGFRQAAEWIAALGEALEHAHGMGIIHRDVKPSNVLIDRNERVYLTDFGLAKSDGAEATVTFDGQVIGTPAYMAPEQAQGETAKVDARTDIYSLGAVLYELLTDTRPFAGDGPMLLTRIREEDPRPPRRLDNAIPADLETICLKAMAKEPAHRYASAAAFAADLRRWLNGEPVLAHPVGPIGTYWRKCRRRPIVASLAASLVLAVVVGFIGVTREWRRAEAFRRRAEGNLAEVQTQRDRATRALERVYQSLSTLNQLALNGQLAHLDPRYSRDLQTLLFEQYRACRSESSGDPAVRLEVANAAIQVAILLEGRASREEILAAWREAEDLHASLARDEPDHIDVLIRFGTVLGHHGHFLCRIGQGIEGKAHLVKAGSPLRRASVLAERLLQQGPHNPIFRRYLSDCHLALGCNQQALGHLPEAIAAWRHAADLAKQNLRCGLADEEAFALHLLQNSWSGLIELSREEELDEAMAELRSLSQWTDSVSQDHSFSTSARAAWARAFFSRAVGEDRHDRAANAHRDFRLAVELFEGLAKTGKLEIFDRVQLGTSYHVIGRLHVENGRPGEAIEPYGKAIAVREALIQIEPENSRHRCDCGGSWHRLGEALENLGRQEEARSAYRKGAAHRRLLVTRTPAEMEYRKALDEVLRDLARCLSKMGRAEEMIEAERERRTFWPDDPVRTLNVAGELTAAAVLPRRDESVWAMIVNKDRRRFAVEALAALRGTARIAETRAHLTEVRNGAAFTL